MPCAVPLARPSDEAMSDRPSRRSPPASSRSIAAARSSDWMFRAIAVLPPSASTADRASLPRSAMPNTTGRCRPPANGRTVTGHRICPAHGTAGRTPPSASAPWTPAPVQPTGGYPGRVPRPGRPGQAHSRQPSHPGSPFHGLVADVPFRRQPDPCRPPSVRRSPPVSWSPTARWAPCSRRRTPPWTTSSSSKAATRSSTSPAPTSCARSTRRTSRSASTASRPTPSAPTTPPSASTTSPSASTSCPSPAPGRPRGRRRLRRRDGRPRWVLGSMGPGTKLPTLGHAPYATLRDAYQRNAEGLIAGGADALLVETTQDLLQTKAAVIGARRAWTPLGLDLPLIVLGDRRDHRHHAARLRDRRRADRAGAAGHRHDRPELRHRPRRDERAPALPRPALAHPAVLHAQRRPARARQERRPLPADRRPSWPTRRRCSSASTASPWSAAAAARPPSTCASWSSGSATRTRPRAQPAPRAGRGLALPGRAVPAGHLVPGDRRAHQRQRLEEVPRGHAGGPLGRLRGDGPRADPRGRAPARPVRGLRRPRRRRRHGGAGRPLRHRLHPAARAGLHRGRRAPGRPGEARRPRGASTR